MSPSAARACVLRVLRAVRTRDAYVGAVVERACQRASLSDQDHDHAVACARGIVQSRGVLDEVIDRFAKRPRAIEPPIRDILRLGTYELLYMRTPARAAVHEAVELARAVRPQAAPFVNALLRRIAEAADTFPWASGPDDLAAHARAAGYPAWLAEAFAQDHGIDVARRMLEAAHVPAPLYAHVNTLRTSVTDAIRILACEGIRATIEGIDDRSLRLHPASRVVRSAAVRDGLVVIMDAAAQVAPIVLRPSPGAAVVDACAGRGTKTVALQAHAVNAGGPARVIAVDVHPFKLRVLERRMRALGVSDVETLAADVAALPDDRLPAASADAVLLDVPCSGTGTLRRHPEIVWRLAPGDPARMAGLQARLLAAAARLVRPGGTLVYATCSVLAIENAAVVSGFLAAPPGDAFTIEPLRPEELGDLGRFITDQGFFWSTPEPDGPDGHFVARLVRR